MTLAGFLLTVVILLALGPAAALARPGQRDWPRAIYGVAGLACLAGMLLAIAHLRAAGAPLVAVLPIGLPGLGWHLRLDDLAAAFLLIVNTGGLIACIFAAGHAADDPEPRRTLPFVPPFLAAMQLVCLADDAFAFLVAWEVMSLLSFALVLAEHRSRASQQAATLYLLMAGFGTLCLLMAFGVLAGSAGAYAFGAMRAHGELGMLAGLFFLLVVIGAGSKAGLVPLHVWLPQAHPAAPAPVSALMSGVMTKVAIYAMVRLLLDLAGAIVWWWGAVLMVIGAGTAVIALLYALLERDLKRLLAYSTIENIGIITTALGFATAFRAAGLGLAAALALGAALLQALNHAVIKTLLFTGVGAVQHGTGTRDMGELGGLARTMPLLSLVMLVGSASIAALPPLNGFVSEWLLFQAVLQGPGLDVWLLKFLTPAIGALLALAAALAAACFVRFYGITFLGRARSGRVAAAHDPATVEERLALGLAALGCVYLGVFPAPLLDLLGGAVATVNGGIRLPLQAASGWLSLRPLPATGSSYDGLVFLIFLVVSGSVVALVVRRLSSGPLTLGPVWDCGYPDPRPVTQYGPASFAQPLRRVFAGLVFGARETVTQPLPGASAPARLQVELRDPIAEQLYDRLAGSVRFATEHLNRLQFLTIRRYLLMMFGTLVTLLLLTAIWR